MEDNYTFRFAYEGKALESGEMRLADIAPALMAIGVIIDRANHVANGDRVSARVNVNALKIGSFEVILTVITSLGDHIKRMLISDSATAALNAKDIIQYLFQGALQLHMWLIGKKVTDAKPIGDGKMSITINGDNNNVQVVTVPDLIWKLHNDRVINDNMHDVARPLEQQDVDSFIVRESDKKEEHLFKMTKNEVAVFPGKAKKAVPPDKDVSGPTKMKIHVYVDTPVLSDRGGSWRLFDGSSRFGAIIKDNDFLDRVHRREIVFGNGDMLEVEMQINQKMANGKLTVERVVLNVLNIIPATGDETLPLDFGEDESADDDDSEHTT